MVKIDRSDFNRDMDEYLSGRRQSYEDEGSSFMDTLREKFSKMKRKPREITIDDEEEVEETVQIEEVEDEDFDEPVSTPRRSLITWLFRRRSRPTFDEVDDDVIEPETENNEEEYREAIKILHKWVEKLDPQTLNQFKRSEDFQKYKEVLTKLKLIK